MSHGPRAAFAAILTALLVAAAAAPLWCAVPSQLNFQGKLLDTSNNPRNGSFNFTFKIYDAASAGNLLWSETQNGLSVSNGVFAAQLGAVTPIPAGVFGGANAYLEITVGSEVGSPRQQLVTAPYAFKAAAVDSPLPAGDTQYIQVGGVLQSGATFYVSSGTVAGPLTVGGVIVAGSGANQVTTAAGLLDATKLSGTVPSAQLAGTYSNSLALTNPANSFIGDGTGLVNVSAAHLLPGDTNYIQNRGTLQAGSVFYASSGTVGGTFAATGTVTLGGAAGVNDVTVASNLKVNSNLTVSGAGPQVLGGNVQVNGNGIADSGGTTRLTLGAPTLVNGGLKAFSGAQLAISTNIAVSGASNNADHYIAFPFTAGGTIAARSVVVISAANTVNTTATGGDNRVIGVAINSATLGQAVNVALLGVVTGVTVDGPVTVGDPLAASATAGQASDAPANFATGGGTGILGRALTGATGAGQTITIVVSQFNF